MKLFYAILFLSLATFVFCQPPVFSSNAAIFASGLGNLLAYVNQNPEWANQLFAAPHPMGQIAAQQQLPPLQQIAAQPIQQIAAQPVPPPHADVTANPAAFIHASLLHPSLLTVVEAFYDNNLYITNEHHPFYPIEALIEYLKLPEGYGE
jgi:hypothetical protein